MTHESTQVGDFTHQAEAYARARPHYPAALWDQLIAHAGVQPGDAVADIGAGTGISTAMLAERGLIVSAIEPNVAMREHGRALNLQRVRWIDGTFDATTLPGESQSWVVAAQAFHWADPLRALPEMRRILAPRRRFTALWNDRDNDASDLLQATVRLIQHHAPGFDELYRDRDWSAVLASTGDFSDVVQHEVRHHVTMSRQRYVDLWRSHNRLTAAAGPRFSDLIAAVQRLLDEQGCGEFVIPYRARAWSARRV